MTHARTRPEAPPYLARAAAALAVTAVALVPAVPAGAATTVPPTVAEARAAVLKLTNTARADAGCGALVANDALNKAAQGHASDMATKKYFSHTSLDGRTWDQRIRNAGFTKPGGENIAYGYTTAAKVMNGWMASTGHKRNILNCKFRYIGIGFASNGYYWVQDFGY